MEPKKLVEAVASWLRFETLCSPGARWQWQRVVYEPLRRYLTGNGYPFVTSEWASPLEKGTPAKHLFDYAYGYKKGQPAGIIEVQSTSEVARDFAKLMVFVKRGDRFLLLVGSKEPTQSCKVRLSQALSFDLQDPTRCVRADTTWGFWNAYRKAWKECRDKLKNRSEGRGHTPNFRTLLEGLVSEGGVFVAIWKVNSTVGRPPAQREQ